jgi:uncharacterized membrane protein YfhO
MNKGLLGKMFPHIVALIVFLVVALIYCHPVLQGKVINQLDINHWNGAIQQSIIYKETHGQYPLWTNSLFSGMPAFMIGYPANNFVPWLAHNIFTLWLLAPVQFFFLACICFYFLCLALRINPYVSIIGSLAFAYATYDPVIISVGHDTKMWSIAYMPALLASLILIFEKKYWIGAALTALFTSCMIAMNHPQIDYYFFFIAAIMSIYYAVQWIRQKDFSHLFKVVGLTIVAAVIGVLSNAVTLMATYEYQKATIRGGMSAVADSTHGTTSQNGLNKDYAFSYSMNISEPFVMMVPRLFGGSSDKEEVSQDKSKAVEVLQTLPPQLQQQLPLAYYWGGMAKPSEMTSGPPYAGAIICFLAILGMFVLDNKYKWWAAAAILFSIIISWGGYFEGFNILLYKFLPFYNKFRAPSMALVIPQLLLPMLAALCINKIIITPDRKPLFIPFKKGLIATGALFVLLFLMYFSFDFLSTTDKDILSQVRQMNQPQLYEALRSFFDGLKQDRQSLMMGDIFRSLGFIAVAVLLIFFLIKNTIKPALAIAGIGIFILIDLLTVDLKYLNTDNFVDKADNTLAFQTTKADEQILADKSYYRVLNVNGDRFNENRTSYHYNSVGGYHAAKLRIYQDLIDKYLGKQMPDDNILDMLNTKYLIQKNNIGQTQAFQKRETAYGPVWFVKNIKYVKDANEEINALNGMHLKDTAVAQESFKSSIASEPQFDSSASIQLVKNDNDVITYSSNSGSNQFAVFSEIYYPAGWKAYIDGKEAPIVKTDYVLRGLSIPSGKHEIRFEFKPEAYYKGKKITSVASILLLLLLAGGLLLEWRKSNSKQAVNAS